MLSQENIEKLHVNGMYKCEPVMSWLPEYKRSDPYHCMNWTFKVKQIDNKYYMVDTYWSVDPKRIELTDNNFSQFIYLFDVDDIKVISDYRSWLEYPEDDRWRVATDSSGISGAKYVVRKNSHKIKERVIERLEEEIRSAKLEVSHKETILRRVLDGEIDIDYA